MKKTYLLWTSTLHQRLYRICNDPDGRRAVLARMDVSESTLNHWLLECDVPQTKRVAVRLLIEELEAIACPSA